MKCSPIPCSVDERNQLIDDFLSAAKGEEVHYTDIAWFLKLDPFYVNCWMRKHNRGNWLNGKSQFWWKWSSQNEPGLSK